MHTPGPWKITKNPKTRIVFVAGYPIYKASPDGMGDKQREDDAILISAAPDLLEALKSFLRAPSIGSDGPGSHTIVVQDFNIKAAKAAIAKATGKDGLE